MSRVDPSVLAFSLSSHRHSYISLLYSSHSIRHYRYSESPWGPRNKTAKSEQVQFYFSSSTEPVPESHRCHCQFYEKICKINLRIQSRSTVESIQSKSTVVELNRLYALAPSTRVPRRLTTGRLIKYLTSFGQHTKRKRNRWLGTALVLDLHIVHECWGSAERICDSEVQVLLSFTDQFFVLSWSWWL